MDELHATSRQRKVRTAPSRIVRAVILLNTTTSSEADGGKRPNRSRREATIDEIRRSASEALSVIDEILTRFDGRRLSDVPTALGTIAVETTGEGIAALAKSEHVKAVMQDQPVSRVS
jgi:hypothetical protein